MKYYCEDCGELFDEPSQDAKTNVPYGNTSVEYDNGERCPHCGSPNFSNAKICPECREYAGKLYGSDYKAQVCFDCIKTQHTVNDVRFIGDENKDEVELNGFVTAVFTADEINDILFNNLGNLTEEQQKRYDQFIKDNGTELADNIGR